MQFNFLLLTFPHHGRAASEGRAAGIVEGRRAPLRGVRPVPRIPFFLRTGEAWFFSGQF
jgi:hypothetical protein